MPNSFFKVATLPPAMNGGYSSSTFVSPLGILSFKFSHSGRYVMVTYPGFKLYYSVSNDARQLFICSLTIWKCPLIKYLFKPFIAF